MACANTRGSLTKRISKARPLSYLPGRARRFLGGTSEFTSNNEAHTITLQLLYNTWLPSTTWTYRARVRETRRDEIATEEVEGQTDGFYRVDKRSINFPSKSSCNPVTIEILTGRTIVTTKRESRESWVRTYDVRLERQGHRYEGWDISTASEYIAASCRRVSTRMKISFCTMDWADRNNRTRRKDRSEAFLRFQGVFTVRKKSCFVRKDYSNNLY